MNSTKNQLHFSRRVSVEASQIGQPVDSGNGYYSYSYFLLPYTGKMDNEALSVVSTILHKRHYNYPFTSMNSLEVFGNSDDQKGGILLYSVTYHHGD